MHQVNCISALTASPLLKLNPVLLFMSLELLSSFSVEDNEATSGAVMLNKSDPLVALAKCQ